MLLLHWCKSSILPSTFSPILEKLGPLSSYSPYLLRWPKYAFSYPFERWIADISRTRWVREDPECLLGGRSAVLQSGSAQCLKRCTPRPMAVREDSAKAIPTMEPRGPRARNMGCATSPTSPHAGVWPEDLRRVILSRRHVGSSHQTARL